MSATLFKASTFFHSGLVLVKSSCRSRSIASAITLPQSSRTEPSEKPCRRYRTGYRWSGCWEGLQRCDWRCCTVTCTTNAVHGSYYIMGEPCRSLSLSERAETHAYRQLHAIRRRALVADHCPLLSTRRIAILRSAVQFLIVENRRG